jgi:hypothetical protein
MYDYNADPEIHPGLPFINLIGLYIDISLDVVICDKNKAGRALSMTVM